MFALFGKVNIAQFLVASGFIKPLIAWVLAKRVESKDE